MMKRFLLFLILLLPLAWAQGIGTTAADFTLVNAAGEPISLSDFSGTPLVLNTWATWCAPCVEELPFFQQIHDEVNAEAETPALNFLLINNNEAPEKALPYLRDKLSVSLPVALDATKEQRSALEAEGTAIDTTIGVLKSYRVRGMPTTFFIDAEGVIQGVKVGLLLPDEATEFLSRIGVAWQP